MQPNYLKRPLLGLSLLTLLTGPAWADETEATEPNDPSTADESIEPDSAESSEETESEPSPPPPNPVLVVEVRLVSGVTLRGQVSQSDLLVWSPAQALSFTPDGGVSTEIAGDLIASVTTVAVAPPVANPEPIAAPPETEAETVDATTPEEDLSTEFAYPNAASSRYLYAPSAIPMEKQQGYVSQKLIFTSVAYAVTDNFTMLYGALTVFPPALSVLGFKLGFEVADNVYLGTGGEVFILGIEQEIPVAIGFGALTLGDQDKNLTIAVGYTDGQALDWEDLSAQVPVMLGGQLRVGDSLAMITENWLFLGTDELGAGSLVDAPTAFVSSIAFRILGRRDRGTRTNGMRYLRTASGQPRTTWDLGLLAVGYEDRDRWYDDISGEEYISELGSWEVYAPMPWIDWTWHFGPAGSGAER